MKAQSAFEFMMVVALVLAILTPIWIYVNTVQARAESELALSYARTAVDKVVEAADIAYSQGSPARLTIRVYIPRGVEYINVTGKTLNMRVRSDSQPTDVNKLSLANLNGTLPTREGPYEIIVEAKDDFVQIDPK